MPLWAYTCISISYSNIPSATVIGNYIKRTLTSWIQRQFSQRSTEEDLSKAQKYRRPSKEGNSTFSKGEGETWLSQITEEQSGSLTYSMYCQGLSPVKPQKASEVDTIKLCVRSIIIRLIIPRGVGKSLMNILEFVKQASQTTVKEGTFDYLISERH